MSLFNTSCALKDPQPPHLYTFCTTFCMNYAFLHIWPRGQHGPSPICNRNPQPPPLYPFYAISCAIYAFLRLMYPHVASWTTLDPRQFATETPNRHLCTTSIWKPGAPCSKVVAKHTIYGEHFVIICAQENVGLRTPLSRENITIQNIINLYAYRSRMSSLENFHGDVNGRDSLHCLNIPYTLQG